MFALARRCIAASLLIVLALGSAATAAEVPGFLLVTVRSEDGSLVAAARVQVEDARHAPRTAIAGEGRRTFGELPPGTYSVSARAPGYAPAAPQVVAVYAGSASDVDVRLTRSTTSLVTIGSVTTGGVATVSSSSAATQIVRTQDAAARGATRISDVLADSLSTTVIRQASGSAAAPQSVALRGPDPTETLVEIDGHELNSGITGDFDLSLLDPADIENVQLVYGISPASLIGPSTIGGAINVRTLEPTRTPHGLLRLSAGNFSSSGTTFQATGTQQRLGYAFSLHQTSAGNDVSKTRVTNDQGETTLVGSDVDAQTALAKIRYAFGGVGGASAELSVRDQSVVRDLSAALTARVAPNVYVASPGSRLLGHNAGYGLDLTIPLDPDRSGIARTVATLRHLSAFAGQSVEGRASGMSPAYFDDRDVIASDSLEINRALHNGSLALSVRFRNERLTTIDPSRAGALSEQSRDRSTLGSFRHIFAEAPAPDAIDLGQTQRSIALRYTVDPTPKLHATLASYYSDFSVFGRSFDPRASLVWTPNATLALRASAGTTFQSPQLTGLFVPHTLPAPDANGHIAIGNPNLQPDHATEYDFGFDRLIGRLRPVRISGDVYRTNLRAPAQLLLPAKTCASDAPSLACASYPINIGNAVYTGAELRADVSLGAHSILRLGYGAESTYALDAPSLVQNGSIVPHEQFLGVPLHKATLALEHQVQRGLSYHATLLYEGRYNELNRAPFATLAAGLAQSFGGFELGLAGTNLTNVYARRFTDSGAGVAYGGIDGPIPTDAYALPSRTVMFSVTRRF